MDENPYKSPQADCRLPRNRFDEESDEPASPSVMQFVAGSVLFFTSMMCALVAVFAFTVAVVEPIGTFSQLPWGWFSIIGSALMFAGLAGGFYWSFRRVLA